LANIAAGNVEIYIRQLLSEALVNGADEKLLKDEDFELTHIRLDEESKDK